MIHNRYCVLYMHCVIYSSTLLLFPHLTMETMRLQEDKQITQGSIQLVIQFSW